MSSSCSVCGKEFTHRGALNLHEYHCKFKELRNNNITYTKAIEQVSCEHDFRFLNQGDQVERLAIQNGYSEVCVKCQSLQV